MLFCSLGDRKGPMGQYAIELSPRARKTLEKQSVQLFLHSRFNWVQDGLHVLINAMLSDDVHVSDYLKNNYPESVVRSCTDTRSTRQTLRFRLRYLLRCLEKTSAHFAEYSMADVAPLLETFEIFVACVVQAYGEDAAKMLKEFVGRFSNLWSCEASALNGEEAMQEELGRLVDFEDHVFSTLHEAALLRERTTTETPDVGKALAETNQQLSEVHEELAQTNVLQKRSIRAFERAMASNRPEEEDPYSQLAGLANITGARRKELLACFRYSHEKKFPVVRGAHDGNGSLQSLANTVWNANRAEFEAYAKLAEDPGYQDARSLGTKLYKLANLYHSADHFVWKDPNE